MTLQELKDFFKDRELPKELQIDRGNRISDVKKMVESHFTVLEHNGEDSRTFQSFKHRLEQLKLMLEAAG